MEALLVERLVDHSDSRATSNTNTNTACDVVKVSLSKSFCPVQRVYPDDHFVFKELIRKFVKVKVGFWCGHPIDLFKLLQVDSIAMLLSVVVVQQQFLANSVSFQLIRLDKRLACIDLAHNRVLLPDDASSRIQLF